MENEEFSGPYKLQVKAVLPEYVVEGERFEGSFVFKNVSGIFFPGVHASVLVTCAELERYSVTKPTDINHLGPNDEFEILFEETPASSGYLLFQMNFNEYTNHAIDSMLIEYYLEDGRLLTPGFVLGGVRAKSREEVLHERHIEALKKATKSQDFLANVQIALTITTIGLAVIQVLMMIR